ncbi:hypothetical protein [Microbacterium arborescens]
MLRSFCAVDGSMPRDSHHVSAQSPHVIAAARGSRHPGRFALASASIAASFAAFL